ncbi:MAG: RagB/SusD family nutrient uptake outer membrane protein [Bacteroides sp.]|jgi:hypothetical protein|nr:RagB/SusD family nutrient uptake outer membrane protein [Bacteroides sp.]MCI1682266.1 RagB/SusD family nutrient uptake outer membrane protein [Bacteroides sp.]
MKKIKIALILWVSIGITSCDFLDKEPTYLTPETYFSNESEASSFLTGTYAILQQSAFYGDSWLYLVGGDDLSHYGGAGRAPKSGGLICNNANSGDPLVAQLWYDLYSGVNRSNTFIENVDKTPEMSDQLKAQYKAEARFLRAYYYFTLVSCWGDVPFITSSTQSVSGLNTPRTDKQTIYNFICTEMSEAAADLKSAAELNFLPGRISKSAAWGILARVYLFRAGEYETNNRDGQVPDESKSNEYFNLADQYAQKVMGEGHDLVDNYWQIFIDLAQDQYNSTGKNESIWEIEFTGNRTSDVRAEGRLGNTIGLQAPDLSGTSLIGKANPGYSYGFIYCTPKLYHLYEANGDTKRCDWNIAPFTYIQDTQGDRPVIGRNFEYGKKGTLQYPCFEYGSGDKEKTEAESSINYARLCAKYRREYEPDGKARSDTRQNVPALRYADVLLMVAEAENEINSAPTPLAYECINRVRTRAGIEPLSNLSKEEFRQAVRDERAMELCFEFTRRLDLIRWGEFVQKMNEQASIALSGDEWSLGPTNVYTYFQVSSAYNYFPIPSSEMAVNKAITQNNPGW